MERRSTRNHRKEDEEEEDNSGNSDAATTTKPTSRALKCIQAFNKFGNVEGNTETAGGNSSGHGSRGRPCSSRSGGTDSTTGTGDDDGVIINNKKKRKNTKKTIKKSNKKTTMTKATKQRLQRYHGTEVDVSSCSSSSSSSSSSSKESEYNDDDDDDEDYVDNSKNTKKEDGNKKQKKNEVENESVDVLKAMEYPLTLRLAFVQRNRSDTKTPPIPTSNGDYTHHKYQSLLTTSATLQEVCDEIDSILPSEFGSRVEGKSLFYDCKLKSVHPNNYKKIAKSKSKKVDAITDDIELLDAISCGGLKLAVQSERTQEPKTIDVDEEDSVDTAADDDNDDDDDDSNDSGFYYHLDLIVFCNKKETNINIPSSKRKSSTAGGTGYEFIRLKLLPLTVKVAGTDREEASRYEFHPKDDEDQDFGTVDIPWASFGQTIRYCHIRHMAQVEYRKNENDMVEKIGDKSAIFIRMIGNSKRMDKITSTIHLLKKIEVLQGRSRPKYDEVGDSKALVLPLSLGWKQNDDAAIVDRDLTNRETDKELAAGSQQPNFIGSPCTMKTKLLKRKEKRSASQTSSSEGQKIFHWLYSHTNSPYRHKLPLDFRPFVIQEFSTDTEERREIMAFIDGEIEELEENDFPSIDFLDKVEKLDVFFPLNKEYPPTNAGLPKFALTPGKAGTRPKTMDEQLGEQVGGLVSVVGTLAKQLGTGHGEAEFISITRDNTSYSLPVSSIQPNHNTGGNTAAAVSPAPPTVNVITGRDVLKTFAVQTKAKRIKLFPRASPGDIYIYAFDGTELRSDQFQQLLLKTIIKVTGKERTKKIVMTIVQEQTVPDEDDFDVAF